MIGWILAGMAGVGAWLLAMPRRAPAAPRSGRRRRWADALRGVLTRAELDRVPIAMIAVASGVAALLAGAVALGISGVPVLGALAALAGAGVPAVLIAWRASQRRAATRQVWPDAVDHLVSGVRSGLALPEAIAALAESGPEPVRREFGAFADTYRRSGSLGASLDELKGRLADPTADRIIETLRLAREVGGAELVSVLRSLAVYLREEQAIRHEVAARQSWVMNAARLGVAAPWIVLLLLSTRPEAARAYATPEGTVLILVGVAATGLAYLLMRRIARLRDDRRWFA